MAEPLLDPADLRRLERLSLTARRAFAGRMKGDKRSVRRGASVEFADFREYLAGDDLRHVDWNAAARLGRLFVKLFIEYEDLYLLLIVDTSASMGFGNPTKLRCAARTAAALGYVSLLRSDRAAVAPVAADVPGPPRAHRGRAGVPPLFAVLEALRPSGGTALGLTLRALAARGSGRGLAIVLSDFLDPTWEEGAKALAGRGCQLALLHVLTPEEVQPAVAGDLRLVDSETGDTCEVSVTPALAARYRAAYAEFIDGLEGFCRRYGADYVRVLTTDDPIQVVVTRLRARGLLT